MDEQLANGLDQSARRAALARIFIVAVLGLSALCSVLITAVIYELLLVDDWVYSDLTVLDWLVMVQVFVMILSWIFVGMWIHRSHANLFLADLPALEFTPGWAVGWYFIPIANLFKPFQAMRELWYASHGAVADYEQPAPTLLWVWWLSWLFSSLSSFGEEWSVLDAMGFALTALSAGALLTIMNQIVRAQPDMSITATFD